MSNARGKLSRRQLLGTGSVLGTVGLLSTSLTQAGEQTRELVPAKFAGLKPLYPVTQYLELEGVAPSLPPFAARVLNKAGYGPRPGEVSDFNNLPGADDDARLGQWLDEQLYPVDAADTELNNRITPFTIPDPDPEAPPPPYDMIDKTALELWQYARDDDYRVRLRAVWQMERLTLLRAAYSKWQLREKLYDFWFNHFNIYGREFPAYGMMPEYDRQLRIHMFGKFEDMLLANAHTASMLYYLDNYSNTWPRPNENYARELLELHTLGAVENYYGAIDPDTVGNNSKSERAGYTEIDVFQLAKALTGWGVADGRSEAPDTGEFLFRSEQHYDFTDGDIKVMDVTIAAPGGGESDVTNILSYLARHYGTARYIAWKLCKRLVADDPEETLVASTADVFYDNRDDPEQMRKVYRHVLESEDFKTTWGFKVKRPVEIVMGAFRAADMDFTIRMDHSPSNTLVYRLDDTSHFPFYYAAPTGYPDDRSQWQGSGPLVQTWRTVTRMLRESTEVNLAEQTNAEFPVADDRTPENIVNIWMTRALGYSLSPEQAQTVVDFITGLPNVAGADQALGPGINTTDTGATSHYQRIIMAAVGLIVMSPNAMRR